MTVMKSEKLSTGKMHWIAFVCIVTVLTLPGLTWLSSVGDLADYWRNQAPPGQVPYVVSKLFGLFAIAIFWMQLVYMVLNAKTNSLLGIEGFNKYHRGVGACIFLLIASHVAFFLLGPVLRINQFMTQYLTPTFSAGFYRSIVTLGIFAAILVIVGLLFVVGRNQSTNVRKWGHRAMMPAFVLAFVHSLLIGSESRMLPMLILYCMMPLIFLLIALSRVRFLARA